MTTVNYGFLEMFYNWFHFYDKLNLTLGMILVAEDDTTYVRLLQFQRRHQGRYNMTVERSELMLPTANTTTDGESYSWGTDRYKWMMSARPRLIRQKLQQGYHLIFTDVDFLWNNDPVPYFANASTDVDLPSDGGRYHLFSSMDPKQKRCGGFFAMVSTEPTVRFVSDWERHMSRHPGHNQPPYNRKLRTMAPPKVRDYPLPLPLFPNGNHFVAVVAGDPVRRRDAVAVHFNRWTGFEGKKEAMKKFGFWRMEGGTDDGDATG
jgi:rhamnogalacturonan II specific xylosyltransferase